MNTSSILIIILCSIYVSYCGEDYYKLLGIKRTANSAEIKKAYRKLSREYHPDKNKDNPEAKDKFAAVANAYETLKDSNKRRIYDNEGEEGLKKSEQPRGNMWDPFHQHQEQRTDDINTRLRVTLEDIYNGKEMNVFLTRQGLCPNCRGTGANDLDDLVKCTKCEGKGVILRRQHVGHGMYQQFQERCNTCQGKGKIIKNHCQVCKGRKVMKGVDDIVIYVEKGMPEGHAIRYPHMSNDDPDFATGDLIFQVEVLDHPKYIRKNNDLHMTYNITLSEALFGFTSSLRHMDRHEVEFGQMGVTQQSFVQRLKGEGMPLHEVSSQYGDMLIKYKIHMPEQLTQLQIQKLTEFFKNKNF